MGTLRRFIDKKLNNRVNCETLESIQYRVRVSDRIINSVGFKVGVEIRVTIRFRVRV